MKTTCLVVLILSLLLLAPLLSCTQTTPKSQPSTSTPATPPPEEEYDIKTDPSGVKYIVDPDKIVGGDLPKTAFHRLTILSMCLLTKLTSG